MGSRGNWETALQEEEQGRVGGRHLNQAPEADLRSVSLLEGWAMSNKRDCASSAEGSRRQGVQMDLTLPVLSSPTPMYLAMGDVQCH